MTLSAIISDVNDWLAAHPAAAEALTIVGLAAVLTVAFGIAVVFIRVMIGVLSSLGRVSNGAIRRAGAKMPGYQVLIGQIDGPHGDTARDTLQAALDEHLSHFSFGAHFSTFRVAAPRGRPEGAVLAAASRKLEKSGADLLIWGVRDADHREGLRLYGVTRGGAVAGKQARPVVLALPGKVRQIQGDVARAVAYFIAKRMQPALGRPEAFRAERVSELGAVLDDILETSSAEPALSDELLGEIETDFAAITLHLSEEVPREAWLDKLILRRRATLEALKTNPNEEKQIDARLDLGRALIKRAEINFDPVAVREASVHLNAAIEALREHHVIRKAQRASESLSKAQSLVETRKRFAVNFNT